MTSGGSVGAETCLEMTIQRCTVGDKINARHWGPIFITIIDLFSPLLQMSKGDTIYRFIRNTGASFEGAGEPSPPYPRQKKKRKKKEKRKKREKRKKEREL